MKKDRLIVSWQMFQQLLWPFWLELETNDTKFKLLIYGKISCLFSFLFWLGLLWIHQTHYGEGWENFLRNYLVQFLPGSGRSLWENSCHPRYQSEWCGDRSINVRLLQSLGVLANILSDVKKDWIQDSHVWSLFFPVIFQTISVDNQLKSDLSVCLSSLMEIMSLSSFWLLENGLGQELVWIRRMRRLKMLWHIIQVTVLMVCLSFRPLVLGQEACFS